MAGAPENFDPRRIVVPRGYEDQFGIVPRPAYYVSVSPIYDRTLVDPETPPDLVDELIEGKVQSVFRAIYDRDDSYIARSYGLEGTRINADEARILALIDLLDEYRLLESSHAMKVKQYEKQGGRPRKRRGQKKESREAGPPEETPRQRALRLRDEHSRQVEEARGIQNLILDRAILDIFSVTGNNSYSGTPLILQSLNESIGKISKAVADNPDPRFGSLKERKPVDYFFTSLARRLASVGEDDARLFRRYSYKSSPGPVRETGDCEVLATTLEYALTPETMSEDHEVLKYIGPIGTSYFTFLRNRALHLSQKISDERYPLLTLMYDQTIASYYRGNPEISRQIKEHLDRQFGSLTRARVVGREIRALSRRMKEQYSQLVADGIVDPREKLSPDEFEDFEANNNLELAEIPDELRSYITGEEMMLVYGLSSQYFCGFSAADYVAMRRLKPGGALIVALLGNELSGGSLNSLVNLMLLRNVQAHILRIRESPQISTYALLGRVSRLVKDMPGKLSEEELNEIGYFRSTDDPQWSEKTARDFAKFYDKYRDVDTAELTTRFFSMYGARVLQECLNSPDQVQAENNYLAREILDNQEWFVSPRGDRFRSRDDPEMAARVIDSLTFHMDRAYPREYMINVQFTGIEKPFEFWFDIHKNLLGPSRQPLISDPVFRAQFLNLILKRLYFITSGILSKAGEEQHDEVGTGASRPEIYRRAHWRHLRSTPARPITLQTHSAQKHARDVKSDYGIDIFAEIKRRRSVGTLLPDEFITYVRESRPSTSDDLLIPNDIVYVPELVTLPL